jgi:hypothetical protein
LSIPVDSTIERTVKAMTIVTRSVVALIAISSWLTISNHCAFSAITTKRDSTESGCPFHSKPVKPKSSDTQPCCKILRAVATTHAKNLAPTIVDLVLPDFALEKLIAFAPPEISFPRATLDTGPPGTTSFAELIGSIRAHAPPTRA